MTTENQLENKQRTTMKLWLVKRIEEYVEYDEYDADIVAAKDEKTARDISNVGHYVGTTAEIIGNARRGTKEGVVLASFNAG